MSDAKHRRNVERLKRLRQDKRRRMYTGRVAADGSISMTDPPLNKTWVRYTETAREYTAAWGVLTTPNAPVIVDVNLAGELEIVGVDWRIGTAKFSGSLPAVIQPPPMLDVIPGNVPGLSITEARLEASTLGGLYVHTGAFMFAGRVHLGGSFDGAGNFDATAYDESVAAYVPDEAGYTRWIGRYFDPDDETFHFVAGALEFWPSVAYLNETTLGALEIPVGCYWCGAVALAYGQTTTVGARFASWREFIGRRLNPLDVTDKIVVDRHGDIVTDRHGNVVVSR